MKYYEDLRLGRSQFSCDTGYHLLNSRCVTTIMPLSLAGTRTVSWETAFVSVYVLHFTSHGQIATVTPKHGRLDDVDHNNVGPIPVNQYQLDY